MTSLTNYRLQKVDHLLLLDISQATWMFLVPQIQAFCLFNFPRTWMTNPSAKQIQWRKDEPHLSFFENQQAYFNRALYFICLSSWKNFSLYENLCILVLTCTLHNTAQYFWISFYSLPKTSEVPSEVIYIILLGPSACWKPSRSSYKQEAMIPIKFSDP